MIDLDAPGQFLVFAYGEFYPQGGMNDCRGVAPTARAALTMLVDELETGFYCGKLGHVWDFARQVEVIDLSHDYPGNSRTLFTDNPLDRASYQWSDEDGVWHGRLTAVGDDMITFQGSTEAEAMARYLEAVADYRAWKAEDAA